MADDGQSLIDRIRSLSREEAMEAALAVGQELETGEQPEGEARTYVQAVEVAPLEHIAETEELARILLVAAAADPELASSVEEILDSVGGKAFILGGAEIVALAALAVAALHIVVSKGRTAASKTTTLKYGPDGKVVEMVVQEETGYGISANVGGIVASAASAAAPPPP